MGGVSVGYISLILVKFADFSLAVSLSALVTTICNGTPASMSQSGHLIDRHLWMTAIDK